MLLVLAIILPSRIWNIMLITLGGLFLVSYFWARQLARGLSGHRQLRFGWVAVGDRLSELFEIYNSSSLPALWVEVVDHSNVPGYQAAVVRSVREHGIEKWRQSAVCQQRGQYHLGPWELQTADPLGIFQVIVPCPQRTEIIIHPPIHTQIPTPLPAGASSGRVRSQELSWQASINASTIRDYQPNDPRQWIHWPSSARRDGLFVRQFDLDAAGDIWLLLDLQADAQVGIGMDGTEEQGVLLAAALTAQAIHQNRAVGLASYGQEPQLIPPARGQGQQWNLLQALAVVTADSEHDLSMALQDLGPLIRRGSALVIITSSNQASFLPPLLALAQRGIRCRVSLFDRQSFVLEPDPSDSSGHGLRDAIKQLGVECDLIRKGQISQPALDDDRHGFWEFKVTGTGKVVAVRSPFEGR
jgi:uncharacterized protein (DUF58 family)